MSKDTVNTVDTNKKNEAQQMRDVLNNRMIDSTPLKELRERRNKYFAIDDTFDSLLTENVTYKIYGKDRTISSIAEFAKFAHEVEEKPFRELHRHPGQHFKIYAMSKGVKPEAIIKMVDEPDSEESIALKDKLRGMRQDFVSMCANEDLTAAANMYADFAMVLKDCALDLFAANKNLETMTNNAGLQMLFAGSYGYLVQSLQYTVDREPPKVTQELVALANKRLQEHNAGINFDDMNRLLDYNESAIQLGDNNAIIGMDQGYITLKEPRSALPMYGNLLKLEYINRHITSTDPAEAMKQNNSQLSYDTFILSNDIGARFKGTIDDIPDSVRAYYVKDGDNIPEGTLKESYYYIDENINVTYTDKAGYDRLVHEAEIKKIDDRMKATYKEMREKNKGTSSLETIQETLVGDFDYDSFPVREPEIKTFPAEPDPFEADCPENTDHETKLMIEQYNSHIYEGKRMKWLSQCMEQFICEGTTFAPDPSEPDKLVTIKGKEECEKVFNAFEGKPFNEIKYSGDRSDHLMAFCKLEGLSVDELEEMFTHPDSETAQETRVKAEQARKKMFETACCVDEDVAAGRATDFYENYLNTAIKDAREFYEAGDFTNKSCIKFGKEYSGTASVLYQTLAQDKPTQSDMQKQIIANVNERMREGEFHTDMTHVENLLVKPNYICAAAKKYENYIPYDSLDPIFIGAPENLIFMQKALEADYDRNGRDFDTFLKNAEGAHDTKLSDYFGNDSIVDLFTNDYLEQIPRAINRHLTAPAEREAQANALGVEMGNPKEVMKALMNELNSCDSGFLKLRGSSAFKDMRKAIEDLEKSIKAMPDNPTAEVYERLGQKFAKVHKLSGDYLDGKKNVDPNAKTNAGMRKNIADKFNTFADIGMAFCNAKQDVIANRHAELQKSHDSFIKQNESMQLPDIYFKSDAEKTHALEALNADKQEHKLSEAAKTDLYSKVLIGNMIALECKSHDFGKRTLTDLTTSIGYDNTVKLCSSIDVVKQFAKSNSEINKADSIRLSLKLAEAISEKGKQPKTAQQTNPAKNVEREQQKQL